MILLNFDISNFVNDFFELLLSMFTKSYNILDSITFNGITLLQYIITLNVLAALILVLFTIVPNYSVTSARSYSIREKRSAERRKERSSHKK